MELKDDWMSELSVKVIGIWAVITVVAFLAGCGRAYGEALAPKPASTVSTCAPCEEMLCEWLKTYEDEHDVHPRMWSALVLKDGRVLHCSNGKVLEPDTDGP